jgi:hypothetical protein
MNAWNDQIFNPFSRFFQESCYQPPVEAISPTGPEAPGDQMDDLKAVKDELLLKITRVDREIAKTESQIAKLKKKYVSSLSRRCFFRKIVDDKTIKVLLQCNCKKINSVCLFFENTS